MRKSAFFAFATLASQAQAAPNVVVDIAPLHGLVSEVMAGVAAPALLLPPGSNAHSYAMRPSDAQTLSEAEVVIWVGEGLTPWLAEPVQTLAANASYLALLDTDGWTLRASDMKHDGHEEHDDHGDHDDHEDHEDDAHDHDEHGDDAHDHGDVDPHAWLDPKVASVWVGHIAQTLSDVDPENATTYAANAQAMQGVLADLDAAIGAQMDGLGDRPLIWSHAAYGYFQDAYGLTAVGAISETDAAPAGPQHIAALRKLVVEGAAVCVFSDPEVSTRWNDVLGEGTDVKVGLIDPIGADIPTGLGQYQAMMTALSLNIADCLAP